MSESYAAPAPATPAKSLTDNERILLIALQQIDGLGAKGMTTLLERLASPAQLLDQTFHEGLLASINKNTRRALVSFLRAPLESPQWEFACRSAEWLQQNNARVVGKGEAEYPALLKTIYQCPPFLYLMGRSDTLISDAITIVGTRQPSKYGMMATHHFASALADAGLTVVSGMAHGIDTIAHRSALDAKACSKIGSAGATIAVLAAGLDKIYPSSNRKLAEQIIGNGAIITEMPLGIATVAALFPRRNRIVAGLTLGTLVTEAALKSGSLITANYAAEQNREVFAVPGPINSRSSRGCHQLIRDGATLVESVDDILQALEGFRSRDISAGPEKTVSHDTANSLTEVLVKTLAVIEATPLPYEAVFEKLDCSVEDLNQALIDLELMGLISVDGGRYSLPIA